MRTILAAIAVLVIVSAGTSCLAYTVGDPEFRALWVDAWHDGFKTQYQADQLLANARANHLNAIAVQMRLRGNTFFPSSYEPWAPTANPGFDALAYLVQKAHTGTPRIEVHCFFATLAVATSTPTDPNHVVNKHPAYLSKDDSGNIYDGSDYWVDPGHPEAEEYTYNVVMDVVNRYDVDGVHLDLIRYSGQHWGYNDVSVARFNTINNRGGQPAYSDATWSQWRRDQVTNLVRKVYANSIAVKPSIKVSAAVFTGDPVVTDDSNWENGQPFRVRFQDWRAWMQEGILDLVMPMDYYPCDNDHYDSWICYILSRQYDRAAAVGYSATGKECWCVQEQIGKIRNPPCTVPRSHGFIQFSYWSGGTSCLGQICPSHVSIPGMPWKSSPTKGHIKGTVNYGGLWMDHASVTLTGPVSRTMYADGTGFYAFIDLPPGTYTVQASKPGYGSKQGTANVVAGQVATRDLDLNVGGITFSNVQVTGETASTATITWTTNIPSTSQVYYGADRSCSSATTENTTKVTSHSVTLTGLQGQTGYFFRVVSRTDTIPLAMSGIYALVTMPALPDIIIDNPSATFTGSWSTVSGGSGYYGADFRYCATATSPARTAGYTPSIGMAGDYKVSVYYLASANRSTQAPHIISYDGGSVTINVNQTINGSGWFQLKETTGQMREKFPFAIGTSGNLLISNAAPGGAYVNADAVRFQFVAETVAPSVPAGLQAQALAHDQIGLTWTPSTDNVGVAGYRIHRDGAVVGFSTTASFTDADLTANKRYTYTVSAYDTSGNKSGTSTSVNKYTLSLPPTSQTITCTRQPGVWHTTNPFVFNSSGGFGVGTVSFYSFAWDNEPTHVWTGAEWVWASSTLTVNAVSGPEPFYLHLTGYNDDYVMNGSLDLGPYYFDSSAPEAPVVTDDGDDTSSPTQIHATWPASDPESGVAIYQYAVGTSPGGTQIVNWTQTTESEGTIAIPEQPIGTVLYVSAKAKNNAGLWGLVGTSDGIAVGALVESAGEAKGMVDGSAVRLDAVTVTAVFADCFYAAYTGAPGGIRVDLVPSFGIGDSVNVSGKLATVAGERRLVDAVATLAP